eukprot:12890521-Prorocentrum_lima.AAC.1
MPAGRLAVKVNRPLTRLSYPASGHSGPTRAPKSVGKGTTAGPYVLTHTFGQPSNSLPTHLGTQGRPRQPTHG